jgi:DNA mismatch repair protein MutL
MEIKLLEESVINKIAAGEVIERPASVVKELVENALDANATQITVEIEEGGKSLVRIMDNGSGMTKENAQLCIQRHATSKIRTAEDLFNIHTLGFRGEGLASIAAVSHVTLETKDATQTTGTSIAVEGGNVVREEEIARTPGTTITMTNLFYNVPARKKHLKTIQTELRKITELMTKYAIVFPEKSFRLLHHQKELLFTPTADALGNLHAIYGKKVADALLPVDFKSGDIHVTGFIGKSTLTRADKNMQHIFVNNRPVQNYVIAKAVHNAYHTLLHLEREPVFFLNVEILPAIIDVNVHPQKTTIRIEKENDLYNALFTAVRDVLDQARLIPVVTDHEKSVQAPLRVEQFTVKHEKQSAFVQSDSVSKPIEPQAILDRAIAKLGGGDGDLGPSESSVSFGDSVAPVAIAKPEVKKSDKISSLNLIGCIHEVFYIAENELGLVIIDQHAAHERVLYERFMKQYYNEEIPVQHLLQAEQMDFAPTELLLLQENLPMMKKLGFVFEGFGGNTMLLRSIPSVFGKHLPKDVVYDILGQLGEGKTAIDTVREEKIIRSACRAAVKANDTVHEVEMQKIFTELGKCEQPFTCPHGRPTMIQFSIPDLEKKFKRVV